MPRLLLTKCRATVAVLSLTLLLAACGEKAGPPPAPVPLAPQVGTARFEALSFFPERDAPASVLGKNETRLAAEVAATIKAVAVDVGDTVAAGQLLIRLDPRDAELAVARAEAVLAQAEARLNQGQGQAKRAATLREKNFISAEAASLRETDLAAAAADHKAAAANLALARRTLEKCSLRAPFRAVVRTRAAQVGELAQPGAALLTLADISELHVVAQVQARDVEGLGRVSAVEFAVPSARHALRPLRVSPAINRESRAVEARFAFAAAPLPPGTEGRLLWRDPRPHLPADLIVRRGGRYGVFVAEAGKVRYVEITGAQEGRPAAIELAPEAAVVTQGRHAMQDGMAVQLVAAPR